MAPHSPQVGTQNRDLGHPDVARATARWNQSNWTLSQNHVNVMDTSKVKCVFVGDGAVGKTSLIISYTTNGYPSEYIPTAIDTYDVVVHIDDVPVTFELCDTPGQADFDTLRPLCYPNADVFLVCFSVVSRSSFINVKEKWVPEIRESLKTFPKGLRPKLVLVGTQSDLRTDATTLVELARCKETPVTEQEAKRLVANQGFQSYVECSSLTQTNLKEVFDEAIMMGLQRKRKRERAKQKKASSNSQSGCMKMHCSIL